MAHFAHVVGPDIPCRVKIPGRYRASLRLLHLAVLAWQEADPLKTMALVGALFLLLALFELIQFLLLTFSFGHYGDHS